MFTCSDKNAVDDDRLYCDECGVAHSDHCAIHGNIRISDTAVTADDPLKALNSVPPGFAVRVSAINGAGLGVWAEIDVKKGTVFGPYVGKEVAIGSIEALTSAYCWQVKVHQKPSYCIDGKEMANSNWMRYVNCANKVYPQNVEAVQFKRQIFFRAISPIAAGKELLVCYGREYAKVFGLASTQPETSVGKAPVLDHKKQSDGSRSNEKPLPTSLEELCSSSLVQTKDQPIDLSKLNCIATGPVSDLERGARQARRFNNREQSRLFRQKHPLLEHKTAMYVDFNITNKDGSLKEKPPPSLESIRCEHCQLHFNYASVLRHHIDTVHQNNPFFRPRARLPIAAPAARMRSRSERLAKSAPRTVQLENKIVRHEGSTEMYDIYQTLLAHQKNRLQNGQSNVIVSTEVAKPPVVDAPEVAKPPSTSEEQPNRSKLAKTDCGESEKMEPAVPVKSGRPETRSILVKLPVSQTDGEDGKKLAVNQNQPSQSSPTEGAASQSNSASESESDVKQEPEPTPVSADPVTSSPAKMEAAKSGTGFKCEHCPLRFCSPRNVRRHAASKHSDLKEANKSRDATTPAGSKNALKRPVNNGSSPASSKVSNRMPPSVEKKEELVEKRHVCRVCGWASKRMSNLVEHELTQHGIIVVYKCLECKRSFDFHRELRAHQAQLRHRGIDRIAVGPEDEAAAARKSSSSAIDDDKSRTENDAGRRLDRLKPYKCPVCFARFSFFSKLKKHQLRCKVRGKIKWNFPKLRAQQSSFRRLVIDEQLDPVCEDDDEPARKRLKKSDDDDLDDSVAEPAPPVLTTTNTTTTAIKQSFACHICDASFALIDSLQAHLAEQHKIGVEQQEQQQQQQPNKARPFACDKCDSTFTRNDALKRHLLEVHVVNVELRPVASPDQARPFACHLCEYSSSRVDRLKRHQVKMHDMDLKSLPALKEEQLRPFSCYKCPATFSRIDNLRIHQKRKHGLSVKSMPPPRMSANAKTAVPMSSSSSRLPPGSQPKKFPCDRCDSAFSRIDNYRLHLSRKHGITVKTLPPDRKPGGIRTASAPNPAGTVQKPLSVSREGGSGGGNLVKTLPVSINIRTVPAVKGESNVRFISRVEPAKQSLIKAVSVLREVPKTETTSTTNTTATSLWKAQQLRPFPCRKCDSTFSRMDNLRHHMSKKHKINDRSLDGLRMKINIKTLSVSKEELRPFSCTHCELAFSRLDTLKRHLARRHSVNVKPVVVKKEPVIVKKEPVVVKKETIETTSLTTVTPKPISLVRPFACSVCEASFTRNDTLRRHQLEQHSNNAKRSSVSNDNRARLFVCPVCDASFTRIDRLKRHQNEKHNSATGKLSSPTIKCEMLPKHFACDRCDLSFSRADTLRRHVAEQHPSDAATEPAEIAAVVELPKEFVCHLCDYSCTRIDRLKNHQIKMHEVDVESPPLLKDDQVKLITCNLCNSAFVRDANLRRHQTEHHGINIKRKPPAPREGARKSLHRKFGDSSARRLVNVHPLQTPVAKQELKPFVCYVCDYSTTRVGRLKNHLIRLHGVDEESMPVLQKREVDTTERKSDSAPEVSSPERPLAKPVFKKEGASAQSPFVCQVDDCSYSCSRIGRLRLHQTKIHGLDAQSLPPLDETQMKPFLCEQCNTAFSRIDSLRLHTQRKHSGAKVEQPPSLMDDVIDSLVIDEAPDESDGERDEEQ